MTTYYDYLRHRVLTAGGGVQLEHLVHAERTALWQRIATNPLYDEQSRMAALAAFDEAAARVFSEQGGGLGPVTDDIPSILTRGEPHHAEPISEEPPRTRTRLRDVLFFLIGAAVGFAAGYIVKDSLASLVSTAAPDNELGVLAIAATPKSFRFVRSQPSGREGELTVEYAPGTRHEAYSCNVEATYRQILEYVRFDDSCETVAFKFLPLPELWENYNYLEGYMVFSTTITSPAGSKWEGSASVYFSINGTT
jgi:hypothetical protein